MLVFASEIKAIIATTYVEPEVDMGNLYQYISFGHVTDPGKTLFNEIVELPVGNNLYYKYNEMDLQVKPYYNLKEEVENVQSKLGSLSFTGGIERYMQFFEDSVNLHLRADVPVGSC